ncbi:MAG: PH domain-containing protein [Deltaproteobacteria bacterium]
MTYPPRKDQWLFVLLMLVSLILFGGALLSVGASFWKHEPGLWVPGIVFAAVGSLVLWILLGSRYEITATHLRLRLGPFRWALPLESIVEVYSTSRFGNDFGWGLALSLDRIRIKCRGRLMPFWISPEDKSGFVAELVRAHPGLKVTHDG